jgi:hypothetical protein
LLGLGGCSETDADSAVWVGRLPGVLQLVVEFLHAMMDGRADIEAVIASATSANASVSAEEFFARADFADDRILHFQGLCEDYQKQVLSDAASFVLEAEVPATELAAQVAPVQAAEPPPVPAEADVVVIDEPESDSKPPNSVRHFVDLCLPSSIADLYDKIDSGRFDEMVAHARSRAAKFVEIKVEPSDPHAWREYLLNTDVMRSSATSERHLLSAG